MIDWGVRRLVVLSAHGGNGRALALAETRLRRSLPALAVWIPDAMTICGEAVLAIAAEASLLFNALGLHAGEWETSELLRLHPEQVRMDRAAPGHTGDMDAALATLVANGTRALTATGVVGDPRSANARPGRMLSGGTSLCVTRRRGDNENPATQPNVKWAEGEGDTGGAAIASLPTTASPTGARYAPATQSVRRGRQAGRSVAVLAPVAGAAPESAGHDVARRVAATSQCRRTGGVAFPA